MKTAIIIPARYGATRFPGKPLALLAGKPIIAHVYEIAASVGADYLAVATDDARIAEVIDHLGGHTILTESNLPSGTARVAAAASTLPQDITKVINIQGDEPFVSPDAIKQLLLLMQQPKVGIGTLQTPITKPQWLADPNKVKMVTNQANQALYFSRACIPHIRAANSSSLSHFPYHLHVGMYGFDRAVLQELITLPSSPLALAESLEQLQWLDYGYTIHVATTTHTSFGIDSPADLEAAEVLIQQQTDR